MMTITSSMRRLGLGSVLLLSSLLGPLAAGTTLANTTHCRTDPIVKLSNGKQVDLTDSIADVSSDVSKITYTLTIPSGVSVTNVVYTGGWASGLESLSIQATNPANTYTASTTVSTFTANIAVSASMSLLASSNGAITTSTTVSGYSNKAISLKVTG